VLLRRHRRADRDELVTAINQSLAHLAPWMAWAQSAATDSSVGAFLASAVDEFEAGTDFGYAIVAPDPATKREVIVGGCGLHRRFEPGGIEIGYWVHAGHLRLGIAKAASVALRDEAFSMGLDVVEIRCDERNTASAAVAWSAGFVLFGTEALSAPTPTGSDREMIWRSARCADSAQLAEPALPFTAGAAGSVGAEADARNWLILAWSSSIRAWATEATWRAGSGKRPVTGWREDSTVRSASPTRESSWVARRRASERSPE
jgi:RimJ/RimL family protein N-acetyltransferase